MTRPALPNEPSSRMPSSDALVIWHTRIEQQQHVERALRPLQHHREPVRALAALLLERERADAAHPRERGLGRARARSRTGTARRSRRGSPSRRRSPRPLPGRRARRGRRRDPCPCSPEPGQELALPLLHRRLFPRIGVVVVEQVQHAVDDEQRELVVERRTVLGRLRRGDRRADHDVADQRRRLAALAGRTRDRARPGRVGGRAARGRRPSGTRARRWGRSRRGTSR